MSSCKNLETNKTILRKVKVELEFGESEKIIIWLREQHKIHNKEGNPGTLRYTSDWMLELADIIENK